MSDFTVLSTKLSTASVDKKKKIRVYRELAKFFMIHMRFVLRCMIFLILRLAYCYVVLGAYLGQRRKPPFWPPKRPGIDYMQGNLALGYAQ